MERIFTGEGAALLHSLKGNRPFNTNPIRVHIAKLNTQSYERTTRILI
uniref:Uncharacterized protein n=1 Tax=Anguilla anguilla TaxID=7936 RepID=A0A0E9XLZ7_ANGAN